MTNDSALQAGEIKTGSLLKSKLPERETTKNVEV
jgi:hypothetical protein